jgi:hypothetical protein
MAKFRPGIPDDFTLNVTPVADLGDYLDEPSPIPQRKPKAQVIDREEGRGIVAEDRPAPPDEAPRSPVVPATRVAVSDAPAVARQVASTPPPSPATTEAVVAPPIILREEAVIPRAPSSPAAAALSSGVPERSPAMNEDRLPKPKAPRREISMTPETLRMSDELLEVIRSGSGQRDTKANELFHALVLLVHEAMDELDPHAIPKRGRWGTPTARAYPLELKNAFLRALLQKYGAEPRVGAPDGYARGAD